MGTHTAIATTSKGHFDAIQVPTETPGEGEILIKVAYASVISFDVCVVDRAFYVQNYPWILGFNAAGTVESVGDHVSDLQVGDRVAAFGMGKSRNRSLQEYCIQPRAAVAKIPHSLSLEQAATIPDNFVTTFYALFLRLGLPVPSKFPDTDPPLSMSPILIYGAGSTTGQYAIQHLHLAGYRNIIATASQHHHDYLRSLGATNVFDYHSSTLVNDIAQLVGGDGKVPLALDCIATTSTLEVLTKIMSQPSKLAILLPVKEGSKLTGALEDALYPDVPKDKVQFPEGVEILRIQAHLYIQDEYLKNNLMPKILPHLLEHGYIRGNKVRLLDEGSLKERVATALDLHRQNKVSGDKVVVKIA
ncbi:chaperonin 10-like protein [Flammula alnicola]|nr:chaperonin 10-like protein [Flammula alnicola]